MGVHAGPDINEDGLVLALDGANYRSFKGEATTNLLSNGDFSSGLTSWSNYNGATASVINLFDIPPYLNTSKSAANSVTSATQSVGNYGGISKGMPTLTAGVTYTISYYARCLSGTLNLQFSNQNGAGDESNLSHSKTITTTWSKYTHTATLNIAKNILFIWNSNSPSNTFQITDIQIEAKSYSTTFTTGTRGTTVATGGGWADLTGNGNNGELVNGIRESADNLGSLSFDGVDDYLATSLAGTFSQITFEFMGFFDDPNFNMLSREESAFGDWTSNRVHFGTRWTGSSAGMHFNVNGSWNTTPSTNLRYGWNHYLLIYDTVNNLKRVYLNGILSSSVGTNGNMTLGDFRIGVATVLNRYYRGNIANFRVYNRALTENEVKQNFNSLKGRYYIFDSDGSSASRAAPSASHLVLLGITKNDFYYINLPTIGPTLVYCILDPAVDGGGWMVLWGAAIGATNYGYSFSASRDDTSTSPINGFYSLSYAKRSAINSICTENKTLVYAGSNSNWLRFDGYIWDSNSHTSGNFRFEFNSSLVTSNGTVDSSIEVGLTNYGVTTGGDFGIAINTNGLDHHNTGSYYNLNSGCVNMYLYQYASGYKVNTGLSGWYSATAGCTSDNSNDLPLLVAMK